MKKKETNQKHEKKTQTKTKDKSKKEIKIIGYKFQISVNM